MRKAISWILLGLGAFLLATALLAAFWAPGVMKKTPLDVNSTTYLSGTADKINLKTGDLDNFPVKVTSITKTDSKASTDDVVVFQNTTCVVNMADGDTPDCVTGDDDRLVSASEDVFATDRKTALAVPNQGKYSPNAEDPREGIQNKWPFDAAKKTYKYWDGLLGKAVDAKFSGTEKIDGLEVYKYVVKVEDEEAKVAGDVDGIYSTEKEIFVEPVTGSIVNQTQHEVRTLPDGKKLLDLQVAFTDDQVKSGVKDGKANSGKVKMISGTVPMLGFILGPILLIVGAFLAARGRGGDRAA